MNNSNSITQVVKTGFGAFEVRNCILLTFVFFLIQTQVQAQQQSEQLLRSTTAIAGLSASVTFEDNEYVIQQSIGQSGSVGTVVVVGYTVQQGFLHAYDFVNEIGKSDPIQLRVTAYPNPFIESIELSFSSVLPDEILIIIYDLNGQLLFNRTDSNVNEMRIELRDLPSGLYLLSIRYHGEEIIRRIKKE